MTATKNLPNNLAGFLVDNTNINIPLQLDFGLSSWMPNIENACTKIPENTGALYRRKFLVNSFLKYLFSVYTLSHDTYKFYFEYHL